MGSERVLTSASMRQRIRLVWRPLVMNIERERLFGKSLHQTMLILLVGDTELMYCYTCFLLRSSVFLAFYTDFRKESVYAALK